MKTSRRRLGCFLLSSLGGRARISAKVIFWTGQHGPMIPPNGADVKPPGLGPSHAEARHRAAREHGSSRRPLRIEITDGRRCHVAKPTLKPYRSVEPMLTVGRPIG